MLCRGYKIALDIARGIHYLHSRKIIHFDLKSNNILLTEDGKTAKIADVGLAAVLNDAYMSVSGTRGAFAWAAPEVQLAVDAHAQVCVPLVLMQDLYIGVAMTSQSSWWA